MNEIGPLFPTSPLFVSTSSLPKNTPSLSDRADLLYLTIQNRIAQMGDLQTLLRLSPLYEIISTLKNMAEMHLLSSEEAKEITDRLNGLEEEMRSSSQDLLDQLSSVKESLSDIRLGFQNGNTNAKIAYLLSQLPLIFCDGANEQRSMEIKNSLIEKVAPLQSVLQQMSPLEKNRWQKKLALIEEGLQKRRAHAEFSEKDVEEFFKNLEY